MAGLTSGNGSNNGGDKVSRSATPSAGKKTVRVPRRVVVLAAGEDSAVERILVEYAGDEVSGTRLHQDVQRLAAEQHRRLVAAEWLGPLGWTRFLWCRKD